MASVKWLVRNPRLMNWLMTKGVIGFDRSTLCDALYLGPFVLEVTPKGKLHWLRWRWIPGAPHCEDCGARLRVPNRKTCIRCNFN